MKWNQAIESIARCEKELRRLISEAVQEGDYSSAERIMEMAKAILGLVDQREAVASNNGSDKAAAFAMRHNGSGSASPSAAPKNRSSPNTYPKFSRRGDELVKVGWSKKARAEYNHRAPHRAVLATALAVKRAGANGKLFNGDALLPLKDRDGSELPGYHAYVALAWLTHLGVVEQHGTRGGYTVVDNKQIDSAIMTEWPALPEWRG